MFSSLLLRKCHNLYEIGGGWGVHSVPLKFRKVILSACQGNLEEFVRLTASHHSPPYRKLSGVKQCEPHRKVSGVEPEKSKIFLIFLLRSSSIFLFFLCRLPFFPFFYFFLRLSSIFFIFFEVIFHFFWSLHSSFSKKNRSSSIFIFFEVVFHFFHFFWGHLPFFFEVVFLVGSK